MNFATFDDLCKYVTEHSVEDMVFPVLKYQIEMYQGKPDTSYDIQKLIVQLNDLTQGKYTIILGDTIYAEVSDIKENLTELQRLYHILADDRSKDVLFNILAHRLTRQGKYILKAYSHDSEQYFDPRVTVFKEDCVYVDCGGLDGYTTAKFMLHCPSYKKIYLYEPMENYYQECLKNIETLNVDNIIVRQAAVSNKNGVLRFSANVRGSSKVSDSGDIIVQSVTLDKDISEPVSFIKMDIEGSEKAALIGAEKHIKNDTPMLAICVYHLPSDLWEIPSLIAKMNPNYKFILRHHQSNTDETVCYAIPNNYEKKSVNDIGSLSSNTELACHRLINNLKKDEELNLLELKAYLLEQVENYQRVNFEQHQVIKELQDWTKQLNDGKAYLEEQLKSKENAIEELQDWTKQLEEAKEYFINMVKIRDEELHKCREKIVEQDHTIDLLTNQVKKLQFHLKEEIEKPWYKKVLRAKE